MAEIVNENLFQEETIKDKKSFEAWLDNIYAETNPFPYNKPHTKEITFWQFSGIKTTLFVLQAIGAAILSAVRTGGLFLIIELALIEKFHIDPIAGNIFGYVSMFSALFAFEAFLLAKGFSKGEELDRLNESTWGLIISFAVTIGAGIFSGLGIVKIDAQLDFWVNLILALCTGAGASAMAFFGSENIGFAIKRYNKKLEDLDDEYKKDCDEYNLLLATWKSEGAEEYHNSKYNNRRKDSFYNTTVQKRSDTNTESEQSVQPKFVVEKKIPIHEQIRTALDFYIKENKELPGVSEFANANGFSKAYVSTSLNEYIVKNKSWLTMENIVSGDKVSQAMKSLEKVKPDEAAKVKEENPEDDW